MIIQYNKRRFHGACLWSELIFSGSEILRFLDSRVVVVHQGKLKNVNKNNLIGVLFRRVLLVVACFSYNHQIEY
jgi:hypothetical protein